jgi:hypothetical protein
MRRIVVITILETDPSSKLLTNENKQLVECLSLRTGSTNTNIDETIT